MNLKYISKNDGHIIDRKVANLEKRDKERTYRESGRMVYEEIIPVDNGEIEKAVTENTFDSMKEKVMRTIKKKYSVSNKGICNFYFEGSIEKNSNNIYAKFKNREIPVAKANFNLDYEVEVKVTSRNFLKIQYHDLMYKIS